MGSGLQVNNPTITSAFRTSLVHQGLVIVLILCLAVLAWNALRAWRLRLDPARLVAVPSPAEAPARHLLRLVFGWLWILDGVLQAQSAMPLGMPTDVIKPTAAASPEWVRHLVNAAATVWTYHPISAPSAAVWIQVGVGAFLLVAPRGAWSRVAGAASAAWGLVVWAVGESFGGIFAPGLSWLFGAPGAVLFYCAAGVLIALPDSAWAGARIGRWILRVTGLFLVGMAVLQAWPGRGFWQGHVGRATDSGTLSAMTSSMAQTSQPAFIAGWIRSFTAFDSAHGWAVNLFVVVALAAIGAALIWCRPEVLRPAIAVAGVLSLATWVLVQDLGFLGGVGTDPNSMIPELAVIVAGYVALTRAPSLAAAPSTVIPLREAGRAWRTRVVASPVLAARTLAAMCAVSVVLVGAVPMAVASANPNADSILTLALDGSPGVVNYPAPPVRLTDQRGDVVSLASLRGRAVVLTFLDPVCNVDCPIIGRELRAVDQMLGSRRTRVALVVVDANPIYRSRAYLDAFDREAGLDSLANWNYLTGSVAALRRVWDAYGIEIASLSVGSMIAHPDTAFVIDPRGRIRYILNTDPGAGTQASRSSFAVTLTGYVDAVLGRS